MAVQAPQRCALRIRCVLDYTESVNRGAKHTAISQIMAQHYLGNAFDAVMDFSI